MIGGLFQRSDPLEPGLYEVTVVRIHDAFYDLKQAPTGPMVLEPRVPHSQLLLSALCGPFGRVMP